MNRRDSIRYLILSSIGLTQIRNLHALGLNKTAFSKKEFGTFSWGVATAAYQIEGAYNIDGKGLSIWDQFCEQKGKIKDASNGKNACDFYNKYSSDLRLTKDLGFDVFRFSISWSRILPTGTKTINQKGIDFYNEIINECLRLNIKPCITLYHWDLPQELENIGGWTNRDIISYFLEFAKICAINFGDRVKEWIVLNEPMAFTTFGYLTGLHAPGKKRLKNFLPAVHHAVLAQSLGYKMLKENIQNGHIGTSFSCSPVIPKNQSEKNIRASKKIDAFLNRLFIEPSLGMGYPLEELHFMKNIEKYILQNDEEKMKCEFDFIGLQHYFRVVSKFSIFPPLIWADDVDPEDRDVPITAMNWEVYPEGLYEIIKQFSAYNVKEIMITENGAAFNDQLINGKINDIERINYFNMYLQQVLKAKKEGAPVTGYYLWTLMDNFEWSEGYSKKFGIVYNDKNTQKRIVKDSGLWFKNFLTI